jgi:hypothetical protein
MPNFIWYGFLPILSIFLFIYTLWKVRNKKIFALYTFISGLTYLFEYFILVIFKAYEYHPNILKNSYNDGIIGAIVSNVFVVPMTSVFVGAFQLSWKWMVFITGIVLFIEELFIYLGIYKLFWWKPVYTGVGLIIWYLIAKKLYPKLKGDLSLIIRFIILYFTNVLIQATLIFGLTVFFDVYHYEIGWFQNKTRDHIAFKNAYVFFLSLIFTPLVTFNIKWTWKIIVILLITPLDCLFLKFGILHLSTNWSFVHFILLRIAIVLILDFFSRFTLDNSCH